MFLLFLLPMFSFCSYFSSRFRCNIYSFFSHILVCWQILSLWNGTMIPITYFFLSISIWMFWRCIALIHRSRIRRVRIIFCKTSSCMQRTVAVQRSGRQPQITHFAYKTICLKDKQPHIAPYANILQASKASAHIFVLTL